MNFINNIKNFAVSKDLPFAVAAFMIWGAWAYYSNVSAGFWTASISAIGQGMFSFTMTTVMGFLVSHLFSIFNKPAAQIILPALMVLMMAFTLLSLLHYLIGTPHIIRTIAPALLVGFLFCLFKSIQLKRGERL